MPSKPRFNKVFFQTEQKKPGKQRVSRVRDPHWQEKVYMIEQNSRSPIKYVQHDKSIWLEPLTPAIWDKITNDK